VAFSVGLAVVFAVIGAGVLWPATARPAVVLAVLAGLAIWVAGENFGMILMGNATDPNSGPLLVLLAAAYWPLAGTGGEAAGQ
jgi:cytochrome c biogenesis protein CcdA